MKKPSSGAVKVEVVGVDYHYYISGAIGKPEDFVDLIDLLYSGKPNDTVYIHLNTPGGSLVTTVQILNAMAASQANVVTIADGEVASAGTLILLSGSTIAVQPFSWAMFHDGSEGVVGKINENFKQAKFSSELLRNLYYEIYYPYFTHEEIDSILNGADVYMTAEELATLLKKKENNKEKDEQIQEPSV